MIPKVSIVVPIYNVEMYLGRCLESLLRQTLKEVEIIAVNDGSTDSSLGILKEYASKDSRVKVINKKNGGVSSARNKGIEIAKGEYIGFVDPDDWVDTEMYEQLYLQAKKEDNDIAMCSYVREFEHHSKVKNFNVPGRVRYEGKDVKLNIMRRLVGPLNVEIANPELLDSWGTVWTKLYRLSIIKENGLHFVDLNKIGTNEDSLFNIEAFYYAKSFVFLNFPYYHYWRVNNKSITSGFKPNLMKQWFYLFNYIEEFIKEKNFGNEYYLALNNRICLNTLGFGLNTISKNNQSSNFEKIKNIKTFLKSTRVIHSFTQLEMSQFPFAWRVFYFCAKVQFAGGFFCMLVCIDFLRKTKRWGGGD